MIDESVDGPACEANKDCISRRIYLSDYSCQLFVQAVDSRVWTGSVACLD